MSSKTQVDLLYIASVKEEGEKIIGCITDGAIRSTLKRYNEIIGDTLYKLACIVSKQDNQIKTLERRLNID